mmetsp:Transcript_11383/g.26515  ORF Transcript_11383/g.26515 Transcript_11383/m.26515 type:complete len:119 (-) Transcript_11383:63-419(-)
MLDPTTVTLAPPVPAKFIRIVELTRNPDRLTSCVDVPLPIPADNTTWHPRPTPRDHRSHTLLSDPHTVPTLLVPPSPLTMLAITSCPLNPTIVTLEAPVAAMFVPTPPLILGESTLIV